MPSIIGLDIGAIGFGLMGLTWRGQPQSEKKSIAAMRTALEQGSNFWNAGDFYGTKDYNSLHLLEKYFTQYPEDADKVVLSIKGCLNPETLQPDATPEGVRRSVDNCLRLLNGKKKIDIFESARVDKNTPIEITLAELDKYVKAGKLGGIALSEVSANTIKKAVSVTKIVAVEAELSLWATDIFTNGVAAACAENDIPVVAYSPIGRGMLTGQIQKLEDLPADDMRRHLPRFQPDTFDINLELVQQLQKMSEKKGCTPAQLAISWVLAQSKRDGNPEIVPIPGSTTPQRIVENVQIIKFSDEELSEINGILEKCQVVGGRYGGHLAAMMEG